MEARRYHILRVALILLAVVVFVPVMAQNTKGDRPQDNRAKVRETRGKNIKKKGRVTTRDIAGRRLRTKNKSSASRANANVPQPATTSRQPRRRDDRSARVPINKQYRSPERRHADPDRQWQGDISGYKQRKIRPASAEESGRNVYPQRKYATRQPKKQPPFKGFENKTASGAPIVKRTPKRSERAWKGDIKGEPFFPPSTGQTRVSSVYRRSTTKHVAQFSKRPSAQDRSISNRNEKATAARMGTNTRPKKWNRDAPIVSNGQAPFVTRGRKNVYWGKMKHKEKATTRDLAGKALSRRNFQSTGIGVVGTDTLMFVGRKPHGDASGRKRRGKYLPGSESRGGWLNDIAGYRLRKRTPGGGLAGGPGKHFKSSSGFRSNEPIETKAPGIGAAAINRNLQKTGGRAKTFGDQGSNYTGFLKAGSKGKFIGRRAALWNNNGLPIGAKGVPLGGLAAGRFSGRIRGGGKNFRDQGGAYTGSIRAGKQFRDQGGAYTGDIRGRKEYGDQGGGYTGFMKARKPGKSVAQLRAFWNNNGTAIAGKGVIPSGLKPGRFSGKIRGGGKNFRDQGGAYTGDIKGRKEFSDQGGAYTGSLRPKYKGKFVGAVHTLWNNGGKSITEPQATKNGALAGNFQGRTKTRGLQGKSVATPSKMWNNNGKATTYVQSSKAGSAAGLFQGRSKTRGPKEPNILSSPNVVWNNDEESTTRKKYPLNTTRVSWNNNGKATTQVTSTKSGKAAGTFQGKNRYHKESQDRDIDIEHKIRIKTDYIQNPHSVDEALKKQKPQLNYKVGNFASGAKVVGRRQHGPNSVDEALDQYHNSASARRTDYQGNIKSRKFIDRRQSPDAKFVHHGENNVKEDRTILTNVKLLWAKLFQKSDSQPSNLKERSHKMRYDKGEKGMWAD